MILKALYKSLKTKESEHQKWDLSNGRSLPNFTGINQFSRVCVFILPLMMEGQAKRVPQQCTCMNCNVAPAPWWSDLQRNVLSHCCFLTFSRFSFHLSPCCFFTAVSTQQHFLEQCSSDIPMFHHSHKHTSGCVEPAKKSSGSTAAGFSWYAWNVAEQQETWKVASINQLL